MGTSQNIYEICTWYTGTHDCELIHPTSKKQRYIMQYVHPSSTFTFTICPLKVCAPYAQCGPAHVVRVCVEQHMVSKSLWCQRACVEQPMLSECVWSSIWCQRACVEQHMVSKSVCGAAYGVKERVWSRI